jgi:hypothetical protein
MIIRLTVQLQVCLDPAYFHSSVFQECVRIEDENRVVEITRDGEKYNARYNGGPAVFGMTEQELGYWWRGLV